LVDRQVGRLGLLGLASHAEFSQDGHWRPANQFSKIADGHAICILSERSAAAPGLVTRPIEGLSLERELVIAAVLGSTTPVEIRKIAQLA
jgi:hypothetical protein